MIMMTMTTSFKDARNEILQRISPRRVCPRLIGRGPIPAYHKTSTSARRSSPHQSGRWL